MRFADDFSLLTSSLVKIIGKSPHSWPQKSLFTVAHALFYISYIAQPPLLLTMHGVDFGTE